MGPAAGCSPAAVSIGPPNIPRSPALLPGYGVSSVFAFGKIYGVAVGIAPQGKRRLQGGSARVAAIAGRGASLASGQHDGRAEAALIATYGARTLWSLTRAA
jgi:hypothetical protein